MGASWLLSEFTDNGWKLGSIDSLLKTVQDSCNFQEPGSSRPRLALSNENIEKVEVLILSEYGKLKMHLSNS